MLFDDTRTLGTWAAVPAGVLRARRGPTFAWACTVDNTGNSFASYQRFVVMPMFLFSGTFFSVSLLPAPLEVVAWFPLLPRVSLCRGIALGGPCGGASSCTSPSCRRWRSPGRWSAGGPWPGGALCA